MREIFFEEKLGETQINSEGVRVVREGGWEQWDSPRLTYLAIADNPEGGLAGKWRLRMGGLRIKNNFY